MNEIARQCTGTNRDGIRCQKSSMMGQQVCHYHGGKNPNALRKAQERLLALAEPSVEGLYRALESNDLPAIISAARIVLDRIGLGPKSTLLLEREPKADMSWLPWMLPEQRAQITVWMKQVTEWTAHARLRMEAGEPQPVTPEQLAITVADAPLGADEGEI